MACEWRQTRIEDVAERVAMGPFGSSIKVETFVPNGVPVISGQHLRGSKVDDRVGFNFICEEHAENRTDAGQQEHRRHGHLDDVRERDDAGIIESQHGVSGPGVNAAH